MHKLGGGGRGYHRAGHAVSDPMADGTIQLAHERALAFNTPR